MIIYIFSDPTAYFRILNILDQTVNVYIVMHFYRLTFDHSSVFIFYIFLSGQMGNTTKK